MPLFPFYPSPHFLPGARSVLSYIAFATTSEEHLDDKDLETCHGHHDRSLNQVHVEDPLLRAPDGAKIPVLTCTEVFLLPCQRRDLSRESQNRLFHAAELFRAGAAFLGKIRSRLVLDLE